ncbi:hypothetical protein OROHE_009000 [Orobanche hederae]
MLRSCKSGDSKSTWKKYSLWTNLLSRLCLMYAQSLILVSRDGFESVHGGFGFGDRNEAGNGILDFALAYDLGIMNTWFEKRDSHLVTYGNGGSASQIDFFLVRNVWRKSFTNCKVIPGESAATQHRVVVLDLRGKRHLRKRRPQVDPRIKWWKLQGESRHTFVAMIADNGMWSDCTDMDIDSMWNLLEYNIKEVAKEVLGESKGNGPSSKDTSWWNEEVKQAIKTKRECYKVLGKCSSNENYERYKKARTEAKKAVRNARSKILIMDEFTVKIMSHVCTVVDTTNEVLEQIDKRRKRLPSMDAIYFIRPSKQNVRFFLSDMSGGAPLYRKAFVFFTSQISKNYVEQIKGDAGLRSRISALSEMNLEYYAIDSQIVPIIHDWTYDALCHDLLEMEGNKYVNEVQDITGGPTDKKDVLLEECDPVWLEIRDCHLGSLNGQSPEASSKELKDITEALPQYLELKEKLSLQVEIAKKLNTIVRNLKLLLLSELEQSLVYGDSGLKEVMAFLRLHGSSIALRGYRQIGPSIMREHMLRFLMIVAAIYPEVLKDETLIKQANLLPRDMTPLRNMEKPYRKERPREDDWLYSRFSPMIEKMYASRSSDNFGKVWCTSDAFVHAARTYDDRHESVSQRDDELVL